MSLFLRCCSDMGGKGSWGRRRRYAEYSFTLVDQINLNNSLTQGGKQNFTVGDKGWGYKQFISLGELFDPDKGFVLNNTILLEMEVSTEEPSLSDSDSDYDHQPDQTSIERSTEYWQDSSNSNRSKAQVVQTLSDSDSDSDHHPIRRSSQHSLKSRRSASQGEPERMESTTPLETQQQDPVIILSDSDSSGPDDIEHETEHHPDRPSVREVKVEQVQELPERAQSQSTPLSNPKDPIIILSDSDSSGPDDIEHETEHQPDHPSVREVELEHRNAADQEVPERVQSQATPKAKEDDWPAFSGLTSSKLIQELSTVTIKNNMKSNPNSLEQHRAKMARYLNMSLESIHKSYSFEDIERIALHIINHDLNVTIDDKEDIKSLLTDIKQGVLSSMSVVETSSVVETLTAETMEELDGRLKHRHEQMRWLEVEGSRLEKEEKDLDAEIQQLIARKGRVGDRIKSTSDELGKVSREAGRELEEVKERGKKRKRAAEDKVAAEENLAQLNTCWKVLKQTLGL
ncbi:Ubiquitin C-terminal hydrolase 12 [Linum grandiflorum]